MAIILALLCTNFAEVVKGARRNVEVAADVFHLTLDGDLRHITNDFCSTILNAQSEASISAAERAGATVILYVRVSDGAGFIPIEDEFEASVANRINTETLSKYVS